MRGAGGGEQRSVCCRRRTVPPAADLRPYRPARARAALERSACGALLLFGFYNIRYVNQTGFGGALGDKMTWCAFLARDAGLMRGAVSETARILREQGLADAPVGVDIVEPVFLSAMQRQGLTVVDAQQDLPDARLVASVDEILLLSQAAAMVKGVYQDIADVLDPGILRGNEIVALTSKRLDDMGPDDAEDINAVSGERCNPHPKPREWIDASIAMVKPGVGTDAVTAVWPPAQEFGYEDEMACFVLQFGRGFALATYCPAYDGLSAARIQEETVVARDGPRILTSDQLHAGDHGLVEERYAEVIGRLLLCDGGLDWVVGSGHDSTA